MGHKWEMKKNFQLDWLPKYPIFQAVEKANKYKQPTKCKCMICSWKCKRDKKMQLNIDTIQKHISKVYKKQIIDEKEQSVVRWKSKEECLHVNYVMEYEENQQILLKLATCGGTLEAQFGKAIEGAHF